MSLSWLDRLTLVVHPQRLVLERQPWRGTATRQALDVAPPAPGEADWQAPLAAAAALLQSGGRGAALRIVVADHFVRYALLPWSDALSSPRARQAMALALLRNSLGERANALEIAVDRPRFGRNGVAAGIEQALLAGLRAAARAQRLRLTSVQPRLLAELATRRARLADGWFAAIDRDWLTLAGLRGGDLACLHNHRASTADPALLGAQLGGLLAAEGAAVDGRQLFISSREVGTIAETLVPTLAAAWQTTLWPALIPGESLA